VGQEDDAHGGSLKRTEADRLSAVYAGYAADPTRQAAWSAENPGNVAIRAEVGRRLAPLVAATRGGRVLDAGCGGGYWLEQLVAAGARDVHGVDLIPARVQAAAARVPAADVRPADVRSLPYPDAHFDLVLLFTVLSSQPSADDHRATLREARRVTAPGGAVVVWDLRRTARAIPAQLLRDELGPATTFTAVTLVPPLARRLGRTTPTLYPLLARVAVLRTHWLAVGRGEDED
jgi:SAM-dependent methyltransferase